METVFIWNYIVPVSMCFSRINDAIEMNNVQTDVQLNSIWFFFLMLAAYCA